jgi:hypothetical protein
MQNGCFDSNQSLHYFSVSCLYLELVYDILYVKGMRVCRYFTSFQNL